MKIMPFHTISLNKPVDIYLNTGLIDCMGEIALSYIKGDRAVIITDDLVNKLYGERVLNVFTAVGFTASLIVIPHGEKSKNMDTIIRLYGELNESSIGRGDLIVALGGGVVGDIAGFVAATYMRGIPYIQVPTTLLAMIDSSIGGKTGVDLSYGKNLAGSIYQPKAVIIDPVFLDTLPIKVRNDGIAEAIKYGLISDISIIEALSGELEYDNFFDIIRKCVLIKADIVAKDEHEGGLRMILNFGHTIGHAIEKCKNYEGITHGEAVSIGMYYAIKLGEAKNITPLGTADKVKELLLKYNLPIKSDIDIHKLLIAILSDKKRAGDKINYVFLREIGQAVIIKTAISELNYYE